MQTRILRAAAATAATVTLVVGVTACSDNGESTDDNSSGGDADFRITTSTKVWSDLSDTVVTADGVEITPIIDDNATDPHSYEPTARDMALVEQSDILVLGGGHYDAWLAEAAGATDALVISALPADEEHEHHDDDHGHDGDNHNHDHDHDHSHDGDEVNEHIWFDLGAMEEVGEELTGAVSDALGDGSASMDDLRSDIDDIRERKESIDEATVVQAHPIADYVIDGTALTDITPEGYRSTTLAEAEPSAADVNAMLETIESGDVDYFINSPQTADQVSERLLEAATAQGIRIIDVHESPSSDQDFVSLYLSILDEFARGSDTSTATSEDTDIPEATDTDDAPATTDTTETTDSAEPSENSDSDR